MDGMALHGVKACDQSIDLLLGKTTSLGTLQDIVAKVSEKRAEDVVDYHNYMPGECCVGYFSVATNGESITNSVSFFSSLSTLTVA